MTATLISELKDEHFVEFAKGAASLALRAKRSAQTATDGMTRTEAMTELLAALTALQIVNIAMISDDATLLAPAREILRGI